MRLGQSSPFFFLKVAAGALLVGVAAVVFFVWFETREPTIGGDFTLSYRNQSWTLSQNARALNLLYVGYVKCPDVCPLSLSHTGEAFRKLTEEERKKVQLTFISVDAEHDTPASVADYAKNFFPDFIGLTGSEPEIRKAVDLFGASFMVEKYPKSYLGYSIAHTDRLFFLKKNGVVIDSIPNPRSGDDILIKIREHL